MTSWRVVDIGDTKLEVSDWGTGELIVLIQNARTADELLPFAREPALETAIEELSITAAAMPQAAPVEGAGIQIFLSG